VSGLDHPGLVNNAAFNNDAVQYYNTNHNASKYYMASNYNHDNSRDHDNPNNPTNDHVTPGSV